MPQSPPISSSCSDMFNDLTGKLKSIWISFHAFLIKRFYGENELYVYRLEQDFAISEQRSIEVRKNWGYLGLKTFEPSSSLRKSDTLFILGSGQSINQLTPSQWSQIALNDSFGLNRWIFSTFVPNFYMFEIPRGQEDRRIFIDALENVWKLYEQTVKIVKPMGPREPSDFACLPRYMLKDLYYCQTYWVGGKTRDVYEKKLRAAKTLAARDIIDYPQLRFQARASLDQVINFGIGLGFTDIVLCGVDLRSTLYFHETPSKILRDHLTVFPSNPHQSVHRTIDKRIGELTIDIIVRNQQKLAESMGISLFTGSSQSLLHPMLPVYHWN